MPAGRVRPSDASLATDDDPSASQQFEILGQLIQIDCNDYAIARLFGANFAAFACREKAPAAGINYVITGSKPFAVRRADCATVAQAASRSDLLYEVEKDLVIELQRRNAPLFFLHSGAVAWRGRASLLVAESGSGKSTTTWALLHHGYGYLSDEMAPIALDALQVHPYPHALGLKSAPPAYPLPSTTLQLDRTMHIPVQALPASLIREPCPLDAIFLVSHDPTATAPSLRALTAAEAAARLFVNALNSLAHPHGGLDAVLRIASHARCYSLTTAGLPDTCNLVNGVLKEIPAVGT